MQAPPDGGALPHLCSRCPLSCPTNLNWLPVWTASPAVTLLLTIQFLAAQCDPPPTDGRCKALPPHLVAVVGRAVLSQRQAVTHSIPIRPLGGPHPDRICCNTWRLWLHTAIARTAAGQLTVSIRTETGRGILPLTIRVLFAWATPSGPRRCVLRTAALRPRRPSPPPCLPCVCSVCPVLRHDPSYALRPPDVPQFGVHSTTAGARVNSICAPLYGLCASHTVTSARR